MTSYSMNIICFLSVLLWMMSIFLLLDFDLVEILRKVVEAMIDVLLYTVTGTVSLGVLAMRGSSPRTPI